MKHPAYKCVRQYKNLNIIESQQSEEAIVNMNRMTVRNKRIICKRWAMIRRKLKLREN